eukprot:3887488-Rhodomonas_salina.2
MELPERYGMSGTDVEYCATRREAAVERFRHLLVERGSAMTEVPTSYTMSGTAVAYGTTGTDMV